MNKIQPADTARETMTSPIESRETLLIWAHWTLLLLNEPLVRLCEERGRERPGRWPEDTARAVLAEAERRNRGARVPDSVRDRHGGPVRDFTDPLRALRLIEYCPGRIGLGPGTSRIASRVARIRNSLHHNPDKIDREKVAELMEGSAALLAELGGQMTRITALKRLVDSQDEFPFAMTADRDATLFVIPCSSKKATKGDRPSAQGLSIADRLDPVLAARLREARFARRKAARVDETAGLLPAFERYGEGSLWKGGGNRLRQLIAQRQPNLVILSGGYGVVRWDEPIGHYDGDLRLEDWPDGLLQESLASYARDQAVRSVVGLINPRFPDYTRLFNDTPWGDAGVEEVIVIEPYSLGGEPAESDHPLGEALLALLATGEIREGWRGSTETVLTIVRPPS